MLRSLLRVALAVPLLAIGLGAASAAARTGPATPLCAEAAGTNHVAIVAESDQGPTAKVCVPLTTTTITALDVLHDSGIQYSTEAYGSLGQAVCQIENVPAQYTQCLPGSGSYWVLFVARAGGAWTNSATGVSTTMLSNGDAVGFRYDPLAGADPPPVSAAGTCPPPTTPTASPAPTPRPTPTPGGTPPPIDPSHPAVPMPSGAATAAPGSANGSTPSSSSSSTPAAGVLGLSSPEVTPAALGVSSPDGPVAPFNPALVIAVVVIAALIALIGVQGLRRRRQ